LPGDRPGARHLPPYLADSLNRAIKQRRLAPQDLRTFGEFSEVISLVIWDVDSVDAAVRATDGAVVYPAQVLLH